MKFYDRHCARKRNARTIIINFFCMPFLTYIVVRSSIRTIIILHWNTSKLVTREIIKSPNDEQETFYT